MSAPPPSKSMWTCPDCGRPFANLHQSHTCSRHTLDEHLQGKPPEIIALYRHLEAMVQSMGTVIVMQEKTRIAFQVRMSFAAVTLKQHWNDGLCWLLYLSATITGSIVLNTPLLCPDEESSQHRGWFSASWSLIVVLASSLRWLSLSVFRRQG